VPPKQSVASARRIDPGWRRRRRVPKHWRYRLAPDPLKRRPKGALTVWARGRRLLWSWWPWALVCIFAVARNKWGWSAI
jgi:hypothetical protein